jgi:ABC-type transporter Mla MlaB component
MAAPLPGTLVFGICGPIRRDDLEGLCARVCALLTDSGAGIAICDVTGFEHVDAVTVDALARLQRGAKAQGCQVRLRGASDQLRDLIEFMGLQDVLPE